MTPLTHFAIYSPDNDIMQAVQKGEQNIQEALHISEDARLCGKD